MPHTAPQSKPVSLTEMILIAEDNHGVRRVIRSLVEGIDPNIIECADGAAAVEAYEQHHPDHVLMDLNMKPMDGLTALREILKMDPKAQVVIVTQYQDPQTRETAIRSGAVAFVGKDDLMQLRQLLKREKGHAGNA